MFRTEPWLRLTLAILATWRVARLVALEDGPGDIVVGVRAKAGTSWVGRLMDCPYCVSIWVAAPAALFVVRGAAEWCMTWLAISGGASLIFEILGVRSAGSAELPVEETEDVQLWVEESAAERGGSEGAGSSDGVRIERAVASVGRE